MKDYKPRYVSYVLRLWQEDDQGKFVCKISLECIQTGERRGFTSLEALYEFLREESNPLTNLTDDCLE
jgi:hypothetical protein